MENNYINTPLNYTGSKYKMLPQLLNHFDYEKPYFIDLFTGGGSVYTNVLDKYEKIQINDIITDLIGIHKELYNNGDAIINEVKSLCVDKEDAFGYGKLRFSYNAEKTPAKLFALMLCCTNNMLRFNKKFEFNQTFGKRTFNPSTQSKVDAVLEHYANYPNKVKFTDKHFSEVVVKNGDFMVYIDPPYSNTEAGYNSYWNKEDDARLYEYIKGLDSIGASFAVSGVLTHDGKSCELLENLIRDGYTCVEMEYDYNKVSRNGKKETKEIIIKNF